MSRIVCAGFFIAAGIAHFAIPDFYLAMMPPWLPAPLLLVQISGIAEVAGGVGLLTRRFRAAAGIGLILLLVAVFPANIQMLLNARAQDEPEFWLWVRLPFQPLLIWWVWSAGRRFQR